MKSPFKKPSIPNVPNEVVIDSLAGSVDWLTITVKPGEMQNRLMLEAQRLAHDLEAQGWQRRKWSFGHGYTGFIVAGLRWGVRQQDNILMLSGQEASLNWSPALEMASNVSRLDLAVTVTLADPIPDVAKRAYSLLITDPNRCEAKKRRYSYVENSAGGQTLYIGSRASDQFGRLYDKGLENAKEPDAPPSLIWRYEVEFKAYRAKGMARILKAKARDADSRISEDIGGAVNQWFTGRGVTPIWITAHPDTDWVVELEARITDDEASLRWLTLQVRPTVVHLMSRDKADQVLEALGITVVRSNSLL